MSILPQLQAQGAPVPRLEGTLRLANVPEGGHAEVMVFEYLPHIGYEHRDLPALAATLGHFHALPMEPFAQLRSPDFRDEVPGWL